MTDVRIAKRFTFEAAHHLPQHEGKCKNPHGHRYELEVVVEGRVDQEKGPTYGMVMDFHELGKIVRDEVIDVLDHQDLNRIGPDLGLMYSTAENIASWIVERIGSLIVHGVPSSGGVQLYRGLRFVRLWEQAESYAECCVQVHKNMVWLEDKIKDAAAVAPSKSMMSTRGHKW